MQPTDIIAPVVHLPYEIRHQEPLPIGYPVELVREWNHHRDPNAIGVWVYRVTGKAFLGYVLEAAAVYIVDDLECGKAILAKIVHYRQPYAVVVPDILLKIMNSASSATTESRLPSLIRNAPDSNSSIRRPKKRYSSKH